ncbi:HAD family hydrolase [Rhodopirellula sp. JC740]|uniref:HAD family hydrolase n=1 Tax=Rhodopirellula halodulae TaxID=2894198 RepID=A0ABS8NNT2_9BACT|nr:HAD family hydrolase [Rhodopirellula sp. JC740]
MNSSSASSPSLADKLFSRQPLAPSELSVPPEQSDRVIAKPMDLSDVRCVLLDVYGTLVISGSGDVGTADDSQQDAANRWIIESAREAGIEDLNGLPTAEQIRNEIITTNEAARFETNPKPEVDITRVWQRVLKANDRRDLASNPNFFVPLICGVEGRANPVWPMPGALHALHAMKRSEKRLGIVSNAQFYTPLIVEDLLSARHSDDSHAQQTPADTQAVGADLSSVFDLNACHFSYRYRAAKPGPLLFDRATRHLGTLGIAPEQTLYVGNDMLNDVWAAQQFGLRTALFAGDGRSLRLRLDDPRCQKCLPDMVLTHWDQIVECL